MTLSDKFFPRKKYPQIYAYTEPQYKDRAWELGRQGRGLLKIGYTTSFDVETRINQQFPIKKPDEKPYDVVYKHSAIKETGECFDDHCVHAALKRKGINHVRGEWFECTVKELDTVVQEIRFGRILSPERNLSFKMRQEQADAVSQTAEYFRSFYKLYPNKVPHFLWNAKMRFGKTFAAYQLAKEMGWKRVLVLTYMPAVEKAWRDDLDKHIDFEDWQFIGRGETLKELNSAAPIVWFSSFQDILGKTKKGLIKERFIAAHSIEWDCIILDEYHFGAWRDAAKELYSGDSSERFDDESDSIVDVIPLTSKSYLYLSGTPFRALSNGEFVEDQIFNWTYADEQKRKNELSSTPGNPYEELPQMVLMTYQMPSEIRDVALDEESMEFDLNEFFRAKEIQPSESSGNSEFIFEHENEVQSWVALLYGQFFSSTYSFSNRHHKPPLPFEDARLLEYLSHTLWFLPNVSSCKAMARLLQNKANSFFAPYKIIDASGPEAGIGLDALTPVEEAIGSNPDKTKTITLTCGKLTTGVTVPAWSGIFMLRNTTSPESYFQAAFRVQSPWVARNSNNSNEKTVLKEKCYVFDFAPNRALSLIADYSCRLDLNDSRSMEDKVGDFLAVLPILYYKELSMQELSAKELLDIVSSGTTSSLLARRWQSALLINVDTFVLERVLNDPTIMAALENIEGFRTLRDNLTKVIASEKSIKNTKKEKGDSLSKAEEKRISEEERKNRSFKKELREKLLKFVTRVPVFMYLTDYREDTLKDVITNIEQDLFSKVTGLSVSDFEKLCEIGVFNKQAMDQAVFKFKQFEESSLTYAGGAELPQTIGGFDTIIERKDLDLVV